MKEDFFLILMISKHWTGTFFQGKSDFVDFTTHLLFARTSLLPGSGCCYSSDHPTVCVTRYTYRDRETTAHVKK